ncbi:MAG: hypothetical protein ACI9N1_002647, partial [Flavobacteriales bacterium]
MKNILLLTPPFTQLNTPYPATAYLKGFLNTKDIPSFQMDLGIEVILALFSERSLRELFDSAFENGRIITENTERIYALREDYFKSIDQVIRFLQGQNPTFARQICTDNFLPEASRFEQLDDMKYAFGEMGMQDKAKHLATLFLEDLSDFIVACVDSNFGFSRYAEKLGQSANSFDELYSQLHTEPSYIDQLTLEILEDTLEEVHPKMICISVPFPGNLYSAFKCAQYIKMHHPSIVVTMGGGFPNTELRSVADVRVFEFFDFISLDDGEVPVELLYRQLSNNESEVIDLKRTFHLKDGAVFYNNKSKQPDYKQSELGTP